MKLHLAVWLFALIVVVDSVVPTSMSAANTDETELVPPGFCDKEVPGQTSSPPCGA